MMGFFREAVRNAKRTLDGFYSSCAPFAGFAVSISILLTGILLIVVVKSSLISKKIMISGKVVNAESGEWPNSRLVLLFLNGKEIGRTITELGEFEYGEEGKHDGFFRIVVANDYDLSPPLFGQPRASDDPFKRKLNSSTFVSMPYVWLDSVEEGSLVRIPVASKNTEYVIKVMYGDSSSLPASILEASTTHLGQDGTIVVSTPNNSPEQYGSIDDFQVNELKPIQESETTVVNVVTVPINNCGGNSSVSQRFSQTQTFVHEYEKSAGAGVSVEIPLPAWLRLIPSLEAHYGYKQGQIDTRQIETTLSAEPRSNVTYRVTWKEVWISGNADIMVGEDYLEIPFRLRNNIIYELDSQSSPCE